VYMELCFVTLQCKLCSTATVAGFIVLPIVVKIGKWRRVGWAVYTGLMDLT